MIRIAIVEDEERAVRNLQAYIEKFQKENDVIFETRIYNDGMTFLDNYKPADVIFMDIMMPNVDGMAAAKKLRRIDEKVILIFVTNMAQFAIKGYEVDATDFILKPVRYYDFAYRLKKIIPIIERDMDDDIVLKFERNMHRISKRNIYYITVVQKHLVFYTSVGNIEVRDTLRNVEKQINSSDFAKCCSGYLVNLNYVKELNSSEVRVNQTWLPVSRPQRKAFLEAFTSFTERKNI